MKRLAWFKLRKSFEQRLLEHGADYDELDSTCDREVWRAIAQIRKQRVLSPYVLSAKLALGWLQLKWSILNGKYRIAAAQVHSGSNQTSGASAGTFGLAAVQAAVTQAAVTQDAGYVFAGMSAGISSPTTSFMAPVFENAGIKAGEVTAYRCWKLGSDGLLHSIIYEDFVWRPGEIAEGEPTSLRGGYLCLQERVASA